MAYYNIAQGKYAYLYTLYCNVYFYDNSKVNQIGKADLYNCFGVKNFNKTQ